MVLILTFEFIGGLSSVAITDTIQAFALVFGFLIIPIIIQINFGGWAELDPETYPRPEFYQTPSKDAQWLFWQFFIGESFILHPTSYGATHLRSERPKEPKSSGMFSPSNLPQVVNGLPWWVFKIIMSSILPAAILYVSIYQLPNAFPTNNETNAPLLSKLIENNESDALESPEAKQQESTEITDSIVVEVKSFSESHLVDIDL